MDLKERTATRPPEPAATRCQPTSSPSILSDCARRGLQRRQTNPHPASRLHDSMTPWACLHQCPKRVSQGFRLDRGRTLPNCAQGPCECALPPCQSITPPSRSLNSQSLPGRIWSGSGPTFVDNGQFRPNFARNRPKLAEFGPSLVEFGRTRQNPVEIDRSWPKSTNVGQHLANIGRKMAEHAPNWVEIAQSWSN